MSLENKVKGSSVAKAGLGLGALAHSLIHIVPLLGFSYLGIEGVGSHDHGSEGILHYAMDLLGIGFGIWGLWYAYQGIRELFGYKSNGNTRAYGH